MESKPDKLYSEKQKIVETFAFDEQVADVFNDMINRSVPGYSTIISMMGTLARKYIWPDSNIYDLGCSTGTATLAIRHNIRHPNCRIVAVDNSSAMSERCRIQCKRDISNVPVDVLCKDIESVTIENASMVVLNFILQFISQKKRASILKRIYDGLLSRGILILSEKISYNNCTMQEVFQSLHEEFKRQNGYSDLEISQKRAALEKVLIPETLKTHMDRLQKTGFSQINLWFTCLNFVSIIAQK
ncbi:MAG: carboxy-S-adenosyl-L-methionine synthase CmoA [Chitinispirillia bacterium]|jgi:tRNA (cmo5U34)-methyltransferase